MRPVGRPPEEDKNGEIITRSTVNVTIPSKLAEFLKEQGVNRSKLFTTAATQLYESEICSKCYTKDVKNTPIGMRCDGPCGRYADRSGAFFYKFHRCNKCNREFRPKENMPVQLELGINVCEGCIQYHHVNSK